MNPGKPVLQSHRKQVLGKQTPSPTELPAGRDSGGAGDGEKEDTTLACQAS